MTTVTYFFYNGKDLQPHVKDIQMTNEKPQRPSTWLKKVGDAYLDPLTILHVRPYGGDNSKAWIKTSSIDHEIEIPLSPDEVNKILGLTYEPEPEGSKTA